MPAINETQGIASEIVLQERLTTNEFVVVEIHENIRDRNVRAEVELGPFTTDTRPNGQTQVRGSSRRGIMVWNGGEYDAIRDTWANSDLLAAVKSKLEQA